ncbi:HNH endonuclease [Streptomyces afghaniensis]|uniref:HNH endonuclease n=1 Tax=Streptomyces afghaniensis TaxID=66865 RepID=UPI0037D3BCEF
MSEAPQFKNCRLCGRRKAASDFINSKGKPSSACGTCRRKKAAQHARNYYRRMPPDQRHTLTHRKRAESYGVEHSPYSRSAIFTRWGYACAYCGEYATHLDHVHPLSKGGADAEHNIVPACQHCNLSKGAKTLAEWSETFGPQETPGTGLPF